MDGPPPFGAGLVTLANWQRPPFNRWAFQHVRELIPTARVARGDGPALQLPRAERPDLDELRFAVQPSALAPDGTLTVRELLEATYTDGFLVLHRGQIAAERYFNGLRPDVPHLLMSVSKSVTGLLAGALASDGRLDVTRPVEDIVPELGGTSFAGATVRHLLDMRTGTRYREDYDDPSAEIAVSGPRSRRSARSRPRSATAAATDEKAIIPNECVVPANATAGPPAWRGGERAHCEYVS